MSNEQPSDALIDEINEKLIDIFTNSEHGLGITSTKIIYNSSATPIDSDVTILLYQIYENPHCKVHVESPVFYSNPVDLVKEPLVLDLIYLVTFWGDQANKNQNMIKVLRYFHDNPILKLGQPIGNNNTNVDNDGTLGEDVLQIFTNEIDLEKLNYLWNLVFPNIGYNLSISYTITPARIPSTRISRSTRVLSKETSYYSVSYDKQNA